MTPTQRKAMEQALEWFDWLHTGQPEHMARLDTDAIRQALRAALAEQPAEQEMTKPAKRVPLMEDEVINVRKATRAAPGNWGDTLSFARAVIAAYDAKNGITGETE